MKIHAEEVNLTKIEINKLKSENADLEQKLKEESKKLKPVAKEFKPKKPWRQYTLEEMEVFKNSVQGYLTIIPYIHPKIRQGISLPFLT